MSEQDPKPDHADDDDPSEKETPDTGSATARIRRTPWRGWIWSVPLAALILVAYLVIRTWLLAGATVLVTFPSVQGVGPQGTPVRYKGVQVGTVDSVHLDDSHAHVNVTLTMESSVADFLRAGTQFWVVHPSLLSGNLSSLLGGAYIRIQPGEGPKTYKFKGLLHPPAIIPHRPGQTVTLYAKEKGGVQPGSSVVYQGVNAGQVLDVTYDTHHDRVSFQVFIREPFNHHVNPHSSFWRCGGLSITSQGGGVAFKMPSLASLLKGCITFGEVTEPGMKEGVKGIHGEDVEEVGSHASAATSTKPSPSSSLPPFQLYDSPQAVRNALLGAPVLFTVMAPGSVEGLTPGSPVKLRGVKVGQVRQASLEYDPKDSQILTPVTIALYPRSFALSAGSSAVSTASADAKALYQALEQLISHGLRAQVGSSNLLLGSKQISLVMVPGVSRQTLDRSTQPPRIPAVGGGDIDSVIASIGRITDSINAVPIRDIGQNINDLTAHIQQLAASPQVKQSLDHLEQALANVQHITGQAKGRIKPTLASLRHAADAAAHAAATIQKIAGGSMGTQTDVADLVAELTRTARSIRVLASYLQRHPEALLQGRTPQ